MKKTIIRIPLMVNDTNSDHFQQINVYFAAYTEDDQVLNRILKTVKIIDMPEILSEEEMKMFDYCQNDIQMTKELIHRLDNTIKTSMNGLKKFHKKSFSYYVGHFFGSVVAVFLTLLVLIGAGKILLWFIAL